VTSRRVEQALRGHSITARNPLPDEWRIYLLVKITGWTLAEIDAAPADLCDWLIRLYSIEEAAAVERENARLNSMWGGGRRG
jgi:hypothetical protein